MSRADKAQSDAERRAERIEALIGLASGVVVLLILGALALQAIRGDAGFPRLTVSEAPPLAGDPAQLRFEVINRGERAAASVTVALRLEGAGEEPAGRRTVRIDFVPSHSRATGAFVLGPGEATLPRELRVESYLDP